MKKTHFEWAVDKDKENQAKHDVSFSSAQRAFLDPYRVIVEDVNHKYIGRKTLLYWPCWQRIMTVRFTYGGNVIRINCAGYWRKGRKVYEEQNKIH